MKKPHLFWILIDSARNYATDQDMRGLPNAVIDFANEGLYFKNVITSAPSTIQSISSMMISSPSYLLSRSYNNYRGKFDCFDYFPELLRTEGYDTVGAIYFKHGREVMSDMFGHIKRDYYPPGLTHRKEVWTNEDVYNLFKNVLKKHNWSNPTMTYLHFNVRVDDNVSDIVNGVLEDIKSNGLYDESIVLINSDHGYPDANKNYDFEQGLKEGWGHDKYMTNDNILTPLVIKAPGVIPEVIETPIATIDIVPTLCSLMGIQSSPKFHGLDVSKTSVISAERLIRTDNRYIGQTPGYFAYTKGELKVIVHRQSKKEDIRTYYNLSEDPNEENGKSLNSDFKDFHKECIEDEQRLFDFHESLLSSNWKSKLKAHSKAQPENIVVILPSTDLFRSIAYKALAKVFPKSKIVFSEDVQEKKSSFDLKIYILESEIPWELKGLKAHGTGILASKEIYIDNNGEYISKPIGLSLYWRFFSKRLSIIKNDPMFLFDLIKRVFKKRLLKPVR
jgi:hypothetical protein